MSTALKSPLLRRSLVVFAFLGLVGLFFALNFFLYIPRQEQAYDNKIFRILSEITRDFRLRVEGNVNKKVKTWKGKTGTTAGNRQPGDTSTPMTRQAVLLQHFLQLNETRDSSSQDSVAYNFRPGKIEAVIISKSKDTLLALPNRSCNIALDSVLRPNYEQLHQDLFDLLLLVKRTPVIASKDSSRIVFRDTLLYRIGNLSTRFAFNGDSLFKDKQYGQFATVHELGVQGQKYKAFSLPFQFDDTELLLIGLLPQKEYRAATAEFSLRAIISIFALLAIVMLSLPVIKLAMCSRKERISINEVRLLMVVFLTTPFLVTLAVGTITLYQYSDQLSTNNLKALHTSVQDRLAGEVKQAFAELDRYEQMLLPPVEDAAATEQSTPSGGGLNQAAFNSTSLEKQANAAQNTRDSYNTGRQRANKTLTNTQHNLQQQIDSILYPRKYKNLVDIYWVNQSGMQIGKWFFTYDKTSYLNLSERNFFKRIKAQNGWPFNGGQMYIEPTISWSTGAYTINIVRPSNSILAPADLAEKDSLHNYRAIMAGIAGRLYSVCDPILPKGYQFAFINKEGNILFHSQTERALHENLLEESNQYPELASAIKNRDSALIRSVELYDLNTKLLVSPSWLMPDLYLVTYFQERERNLFVLHITMFTFFCTSFVLFLFLLFHLLKATIVRTSELPQIFRYPTSWMQPSASRLELYKQLITTQAKLIGAQFILALFSGIEMHHWDEMTLLFCALLPFEFAISYYLLRSSFNHAKRENTQAASAQKQDQYKRKLITFYLAFTAPIILFFFWRMDSDPSKAWLLVPVLLSVASAPYLALQAKFRTGPDAKDKTLYQTFAHKAAAKELPTNRGGDEDSVQEQRPEHAMINEPPEPAGAKTYERWYFFALLSSIFWIAVLPTIGFLLYGFKQEKQVSTETEQMVAAQAITERRLQLNKELENSKLGKVNALDESAYIAARKLDTGYGIYLPNKSIYVTNKLDPPTQKIEPTPTQSPIYRIITRFLFLPKDHAEFFDNNRTFFWTAHQPQTLNVVNYSDKKTPNSFQLTYHTNSSLHPGFKDIFGDLRMLFLAVSLVILALALYQLIKGMVHRIFLHQLFPYDTPTAPNGNNAAKGDNFNPVQNKPYEGITLSRDDEVTLGIESDRLDHVAVNKIERDVASGGGNYGRILHLEYLLTPTYNRIWSNLSNPEKLVLYDFALDGITNYRNSDIIYKLYRSGILVRKEDGHLELMSQNFRRYLLSKSGSAEITDLEENFKADSTWKNIKSFIYMLFLAVMVFLFATQQDLSNRVIAIVSGLATVTPLLLRLFDRNTPSGTNAKA